MNLRRLLILSPLLALAACQSLPAPGPQFAHEGGVPPAPPMLDARGEAVFHVLAGEMAAQHGQLVQAATHFLAAARHESDARLAERATQYALLARSHEMALEAAQLWAEVDPQRMEARRALVMLLLHLEQVDEATHHALDLLELRADDREDALRDLIGLLRGERSAAALALMDKVVEAYPQEPEAWRAHAHVAATTGEFERAMRSLGRALELRPDWADALVLKADVLARSGQRGAAIELLYRELARDPGDHGLRTFLARMLVDEQRHHEALAEYLVILADDPANADARLAAGLLALQLGELVQAERHLLALLDTGERTQEAGFFLGQTAERQGHPERALEWYRTVYQGSYFMDAQVRIALLMADGGDIEDARRHLRMVEPVDLDEELRLYLVEAELLRRARHYDDAYAVLSEALTTIPDQIELLYARALVAASLGWVEQVEADLSEVLRQEPDNAMALNALGYTWADHHMRLDEAYAMIRRALEQEPDNAAILDSMGWVYFRMGELERARHYLERALAIEFDAEIAAHLGEVFWVQGHHEQAREVWRRAADHDPDHPVLRETVDRLDP